ncbi:MAG: hypothetical protein IPK99_07445 [Flavobacteriales bacterium]|nr:hypothetical protein [Flavobacteriales bacterium]
MRIPHILSVLLQLGVVLSASAQDGTFEILKGGEVVGHILVGRTISGDRISYKMTSKSEIDIVWTHHVRTALATEYVGERVIYCCGTIHVNDGVRDSSQMRAIGEKALCYIHPGEVFAATVTNEWTSARMYYEEPIGQDSIFVESRLRDCPITRIGDGEYRLVLPGNHANFYIYRDGVLREVRVNRTWLDLVFRRV